MSQYQPYQQPYTQNPYPTQSYERPASETDTLGSWMLAVFLMMIPIVGFIYLLVLAFGGTESIAKKNYARATLLWSLIMIVVAIVIVIIASITGGLWFSSMVNSTSYNY
ncbi:MAG: hypothetical protein ACTHXA_13005 [Gulosibacter sp.]|uniref:hypothetical protein n=1 Tax=Gulosibacter sp. TaxID=2817531 RepID=UPI003F8E5A88